MRSIFILFVRVYVCLLFRAMTAMGLLNTIESMVNVLEENKPIMQQLEPVVLSIVGYVLQNNSQGTRNDTTLSLHSQTLTVTPIHTSSLANLILI